MINWDLRTMKAIPDRAHRIERCVGTLFYTLIGYDLRYVPRTEFLEFLSHGDVKPALIEWFGTNYDNTPARIVRYYANRFVESINRDLSAKELEMFEQAKVDLLLAILSRQLFG